MLPLEGIKVLDLSRLAPGPYGTMVLADLGADVLLIEAPPGSTSSVNRPSEVKDQARKNAYNALRRNKRSIVLNLKSERGRAVFHKLVQGADVVVEGFRPGVMARLGSDYETLRRINPRIIFCSLSGYGQDGPYVDRVGHDINYISIAGMLGAMGTPEAPALPLNIVADFAGGGLMAALGILAAIIARGKTGEGQLVDIAMTDGVMYLMAMLISGVLAGEPVPVPNNHYLNGVLPQYNTYRTKDGGWISLGSLEGKFWHNLCRAMECEQYAERPFDPAIFEEAKAHFRERFLTKTRAEWMEILGEIEICVAPVYTLDEALADPHNRARRMVETFDDPRWGKVEQVGIGPKFSATPGAIRSLAPTEGEHTNQVLADLGYSAAHIGELAAAGDTG